MVKVDEYGIGLVEHFINSIGIDKLKNIFDYVDWEKFNIEKERLINGVENKMQTNKFKELSQILSRNRQSGKTTAVCMAAKEIGATILCYHNQQARMINKKFNVNAVDVIGLEKLYGNAQPFLLDHYTVETLLNDAGDEINSLKEEIKSLKEDLEQERRYKFIIYKP